MNPSTELAGQQEAVRKNIREGASLSTAYVTMNVPATIVARAGLFANSPAVVIGAMVIAMLLGPITGIALALVDGDTRLLRMALAAEIGGVIIVVATAFIGGKIFQHVPLTDEIMARTAPNLLDLIIALAGGAAGAYATASRHVSVGLVGVAIATALVPPLSSSGILLARGESQLAFGVFLPALTNIVAIQFASSGMFWLFGYHQITRRPQEGQSRLLGNAISLGLLVVLTVVLGFSFTQSLAKQRFEASVRDNVTQALDSFPGAYLADLRFGVAHKADDPGGESPLSVSS
ncbi:TIGR00341 family protein [bacterium]|nr:MAG: TIGR00341 family protein [bacterium]